MRLMSRPLLFLAFFFVLAQPGLWPESGPATAPADGSSLPPGAQEAPLACLPDDPSPWIGLSPAEAEARLGTPVERRALPGDALAGGGTVAVFLRGLSLYAIGDHLWQIRFGEGYEGSVYGVFVGDGEDKIISTLGTPWSRLDGILVFRFAWRGYPLRLRVVLDAGKARDIYLYRADF